jgi:hypothetical protein
VSYYSTRRVGMSSPNPEQLEQRRCTVRIPKGESSESKEDSFEGFVIHRGAQHSRVAIPDAYREKLRSQRAVAIESDNNALIPNEWIEEMGEKLEPGHQRGGISAAERASAYTEPERESR